MSNDKQQILDWVASGHLAPSQLERALEVTHSVPSPADNLRFLSRVVLTFAMLLLCSGVIFFFAYNWDDLSRYSKFAIAQGALILSLLPLLRSKPTATCWANGLVCCLFVSRRVTGTGWSNLPKAGADTYELFLVWAALIAPWVLLARLPALWLLLLLLLNLSLGLAFS